ncbi:hypothetical protein BGW39_010572 [Mortierella sp. 14UC]|nr:hypothetical protein BGW39_010572 [Mortierella sp. 14UC]
MGRFFDSIEDGHAAWIKKQKIVFVSTAPLDPNGKINLSPKGYECFRVIGPNQVCYLELTGPKIIRLFGHGTIHRVGSPTYKSLLASHYTPENCDIYSSTGIRSIILVDVYKVGTSCGWGVPFFEYKGPRETLSRVAAKRTQQQIAGYWAKGNTTSLDGLPGMRHEMMGPEWAVLSSEDRKKLEKFKAMRGVGAAGRWWDLKYVVDNASLVAVGAGIGTVVGAAAAVLFMNRHG